MKALTYSANQAVETDDGTPAKEMGTFTIAVTMLLSIALGVVLFVIVPERLAHLVSNRPSLMFSTVSAFEDDLDAGEIPDGLRQEFGDNSILLSDEAAASIEERGNRWLITDGDNQGGYIVKKEEEKLSIYLRSSRPIIFNVADGIIRLAVFLVYILLISRSKYIARVFEYHGAEHKSIHTYEAGEELTAENALKYSPLHPRCGTAFLMTVIVMSILVFSIFGKPESIFVRIGIRLAFIPFIAGVSYEIIKLASKKQNSRLIRILMFPGLRLQRLTTREPSKDQIQVAIRSLEEVLAMEADGVNSK
jgi:uncharacterized protein YqhQ